MLSPDAKALVEIDPKLQASKESVTRLEKLQTEKNEKMKAEALGEFHFYQSQYDTSTLAYEVILLCMCMGMFESIRNLAAVIFFDNAARVHRTIAF